jgi:hypothetical protein
MELAILIVCDLLELTYHFRIIFPVEMFACFTIQLFDGKKVQLVVRRKSQCFMQRFIFQINYYFQLGYKINIYSTFLVSC